MSINPLENGNAMSFPEEKEENEVGLGSLGEHIVSDKVMEQGEMKMVSDSILETVDKGSISNQKQQHHFEKEKDIVNIKHVQGPFGEDLEVVSSTSGNQTEVPSNEQYFNKLLKDYLIEVTEQKESSSLNIEEKWNTVKERFKLSVQRLRENFREIVQNSEKVSSKSVNSSDCSQKLKNFLKLLIEKIRFFFTQNAKYSLSENKELESVLAGCEEELVKLGKLSFSEENTNSLISKLKTQFEYVLSSSSSFFKSVFQSRRGSYDLEKIHSSWLTETSKKNLDEKKLNELFLEELKNKLAKKIN